MFPGAPSHAQHLRADADAAFVQRFDGDLISLAHFAEQVGLGHFAIFQDQLAGGGSANAQLVFFLTDAEAGKVFLDDKGSDAFVSGGRIDRGHENENPRFLAVGDPKFAAVQNVSAALQFSARLQGKGIRAGGGLAESVGADRIGGDARKILLLLLFIRPAQQRVGDQGILHVYHDAGRGIHAGGFLNRQNGFEEAAAGAAILLGNLNAHEAELEKLIDQRALEDALFIHLAHQRADFFLSEPADVVAEQDLIFGQRDQRRRRCGFLGEGFGHNAFLDASLSAWE